MGWDFQFSRQTEVAAIEQATQKPQDREILRRGLDAFAKAVQSRSLSTKDLEPLLEGLRRTDSAVWTRAGTWLVRLTNGFDEAQKALREILTAPRWTDRFHAVASLDEPAPAALRAELLRAALRDSDARVRAKAGEVCLSCNLRELLPDLERALSTETDPDARKTLQFTLPLLQGKKIAAEGRTTERLRDGTITSTTESSRMEPDSETIFVRIGEAEPLLKKMTTFFEGKGRTLVRDSRTHRPLGGKFNVEDQGGRYFVLSQHPDGWVSIRERGGMVDPLLAKALEAVLREKMIVLPRKSDSEQAKRLAASHGFASPFESYAKIENDPSSSPETQHLFVCFRKKEFV